jgi:hypothetical protein
MPTPLLGETLISVEQYLATSYEPDCDYVDGRIEERNLGEFDHSSVQTRLPSISDPGRNGWVLPLSSNSGSK